MKLVAGKQCSFIIDVYGRIYSWGLNNHNQLGHNDSINRQQPEMINPSYFDNRIMIDIDCKYQSVVALNDNGQLYCWGQN